MKKITLYQSLFLIPCSVMIFSCGNSTVKNDAKTDSDTTKVDTVAAPAITVTPITDSPEFPGATLKLESVNSEKVGTDSAKIHFKYDVLDYKLSDMTAHQNSEHMANSKDGQHIHFILDNQPYTALYKPENTITLPLNSEHYLLSFLSRSYHESIKTPEASKLIKFKVDPDGKVVSEDVPQTPALFYSRPKGEYKGDDTKTVLLDFFIANTTLSPTGNKVIADINGSKFTIDKWVPYEIKGLPMGESTIILSLVDKDGNALTGDNVTIERKITLSE